MATTDKEQGVGHILVVRRTRAAPTQVLGEKLWEKCQISERFSPLFNLDTNITELKYYSIDIIYIMENISPGNIIDNKMIICNRGIFMEMS